MVVSKKEIEQCLQDGGKIHYNLHEAKASLLSKNGYCFGTIKFNTYLQFDLREDRLRDGQSVFTRLRRPDPWCVYDEYQLKDTNVDIKRIWRNW